MYNFMTLRCCHCHSVILNLPEPEVVKLDGLTFQCECCSHQNRLAGAKFIKDVNSDPYLNIMSIESLLAL